MIPRLKVRLPWCGGCVPTAEAQYASRSGVTVDNVPSGGRIANVFTTPGEPTVLYVETFHTVQQEQQNADFHVMAIG